MKRFFLPILLFCSFTASAEMLPGFRIEEIAPTHGFLTSIVFDREGNIYYSETEGDVFRLDGTASTLIAHFDTAAEGNAALLGVAFAPDGTLIAHHVAPDLTADLVSRLNLVTGERTELARLICDQTRVCSTEHHGGNPIVREDGTVFVAIGEFGGPSRAQHPTNPGGKIHRFAPDGTHSVFALGFRNPYDIAWDAKRQKLIVPDNGPYLGDEVNIVGEGDNGGWHYTWGLEPPVPGTLPPVYVFLDSVAPTGTTLTNGRGRFAEGGLLVGGFVSRAIYYFPNLDAPVATPVPIMIDGPSQVIDVVQRADGEVLFGTPWAIYRLVPPRAGDADGNGVVDRNDYAAIEREIGDGDGASVFDSHRGDFAGSWGADVNGDGIIDALDLEAIRGLLSRRRLVRR